MIETLCAECSRQLPPDAPDSLCPYCLLAIGDQDVTADATVKVRGRFQPPEPNELQQHFASDQLEILELIGSGGMGAVYHARQQRLMRDVALKILPPELASSPGFDDRFEREAQVLARLDHPNVVDVYDFGKLGPYSYLMLEYVDGVNLRDLMLGGIMEPADAFEIIPQICDALQYAHDQGIVHRDIKPENILVDNRGRVKITDFGLAKIAGQDADDRSLTGTHQVMGTPNYMAPEQIEKPRQVDHRADIYALGVVFYELLTGELPLGRFDPPSRKGKGPRRLDKVVMKTLEKEPDRRYKHASDVKSDVEKVGGESAGHSSARQAADFVSRSASSARDSIEAVAQEHPAVRDVGYAAVVFSVYLAFFFSLFMGIAMPLFVFAGCALSMLVAYLQPSMKPHRFVSRAATVPLWIDAQIRSLWRRFHDAPGVTGRSGQAGDQDGSKNANQKVAQGNEDDAGRSADQQVDKQTSGPAENKDRNNLSSVAVPIWFLTALFFLGMTTVEEVFLFGAIVFLLCSYAVARYQLGQRAGRELTTWERWCIYPPIVVLLAIILVPIVVAPSWITAAVLLDNHHDVHQFLNDYGSEPSRLEAVAFGVSLALLVQAFWLALLLLMAGVLRNGVKVVTYPFLREWDGRWSLTGAVICTCGAIVFGIAAWTIGAA